jgi:amidophosphoribosyltransferase
VDGKAREECGVAAVKTPEEDSAACGGAAYYLYKMLLQQQHRGQSSAGITTYNPQRTQIIDTLKELGMVNEVFGLHHGGKKKAILARYRGVMGIGHVRYATSGSEERENAQPFERHHGKRWKWFSFAFNGHLANFSQLKSELLDSGYHLIRDTDTEILMHFISKQFVGEEKRGLVEAFSALSGKLDGAYNIVFINAEGNMVVLRDPLGIRPLCYAERDGFFAAASESCALNSFAGERIRTLAPGKMILVGGGSVEVKRYAKSTRRAHCMFEWVYFANPASVIDGKSVYETRWALGRELAKKEPLAVNRRDYVVVAVPDTAKPAADSYAHCLGIPSMEGLIRNRYVGRTFIEGRSREEIAREKYSLNKSVIKGKRVILVDDSIVRGTTGKALIDFVRRGGKPKELHMRVSCPPIKYPCYQGTDMSTLHELAIPRHMDANEVQTTGIEASDKAVNGVKGELGLDSLGYQSIAGLVRAIGMGGSRGLCMACLTGEYPTECTGNLFQKALASFLKSPNKKEEIGRIR